MSLLGVYFGPEIISIVQSAGRRILNSSHLLMSSILTSHVGEKVPFDIKIAAIFKDEFRKLNISPKEGVIALSGKDLIIRTFEMPMMPSDDLAGAVSFEARKHVPFKIEDLSIDYQLRFDKSIRRNIALLAAMKKDVLDVYISIFNQLNLRIVGIEYTAFSILRLLKIAGVGQRKTAAVLSMDLVEADEINFLVLENGFPLFSRDIILKSETEPAAKAESADVLKGLEKLKSEMRASLDYFRRKFPTKDIREIFIISGRDYQADLASFAKEIDIAARFINVNQCIGKPVPFSLSFIKAYCASLAKTVRIPVSLDLLSARSRVAREKEKEPQEPVSAISFLKGLRIQPPIIAAAILICVGALGFGMYQKLPLYQRLAQLKSERPAVLTANPDADYKELTELVSSYKNKIDTLNSAVSGHPYLTELLDTLPRIIPERVWLKEFSFRETDNGAELVLRGLSYAQEASKEFELVNAFVSELKASPLFKKYFTDITIGSLDTTIDFTAGEKTELTKFEISCKADFRKKK